VGGTYTRDNTTARDAFGSPFDWALLGYVAAADILLALALNRPEWVIPVVQYILLAIIMAAAIRLAVIVCDPRQPRRRGHNGNGGNGGRWHVDPPWPPGWYLLLLLAAATIGIILAYTGLYWHFGAAPPIGISGWQESMTLSIGTISTVSGPAIGPPSGFVWVGASQELVDLVFFSVLVTIAIGRFR
jgi:hypothetical protein